MKIIADEVPALIKGKTKVPLDNLEYVTALIYICCQFKVSSACWNHTISAAKVWVRNHNAASSEILCIFEICSISHQNNIMYAMITLKS